MQEKYVLTWAILYPETNRQGTPEIKNKMKVISQPSIFGCELLVLGHAPTNQTRINHWLK